VLKPLPEEDMQRFKEILNICGKEDRKGYKKVKMVHGLTNHYV
jgi:hypothetical protein